MSDGDVLKIDAITKLEVSEFHMALAHRLDKNKMEANLRNKKQGSNVTEL
tara:strand:+ start:840 stop:989 length:150 start_codon:yes stop_codon:yes gene_type:complete